MKGVKNVSATVGRAENGATEIVGGNVAQIWAFLYQDQRHEERSIVAKVATLGYLAPGARISAAGAANAGAPPITFTLTGPAEELDAASKKLVNFIAKQPNATDVTASNSDRRPALGDQHRPRSRRRARREPARRGARRARGHRRPHLDEGPQARRPHRRGGAAAARDPQRSIAAAHGRRAFADDRSARAARGRCGVHEDDRAAATSSGKTASASSASRRTPPTARRSARSSTR